MTAPRLETIERERDKLFLTDAELIRRLGIPENIARDLIQEFTDKCGFPQKQKLLGGRRYWPAVKDWLDRTYGSPRNR